MMGALDAQLVTTRVAANAPSGINVRATPDTFGAGVGDAIQRTGASIAQDMQQSIQKSMRDDARKANTALNRAAVELGALEDEYSSYVGDQVDAKLPEVQAKRDAVRSKYAKDLSPEQSALFDEDFTNASMRFDGRIQSHKTRQNIALEKANEEGKLLTLVSEAARSGSDPYKLAELSATFDKTLAQIASTNGIPAGSDAEKAMYLEEKGKFHASVIATMLSKDQIGAASQYLTANDGEVSPEVRSRVQNEITAANKRAAADNEVNTIYAISSAYFDPNKSHAEQAAQLRKDGTEKGWSAKVMRGALADLNAQYGEHESAVSTSTKNAIVLTKNMSRGEINTYFESPEYKALPDYAQETIRQSHLEKGAMPYDQEKEYLAEMRRVAQTQPELLVKYKTDLPPELNQLTGDGKTELLELLDIANQSNFSKVEPTKITAPMHVKDMLNSDFITTGKDATPESTRMNSDLAAEMDRFNTDFFSVNKRNPSYKESVEHYEASKIKVISGGIKTTFGALSARGGGTGEVELDEKSVRKFSQTSTGYALRNRVTQELAERGVDNPAAVADNLMKSPRVVAQLAQFAYLQRRGDQTLFEQRIDAALAINAKVPVAATPENIAAQNALAKEKGGYILFPDIGSGDPATKPLEDETEYDYYERLNSQ